MKDPLAEGRRWLAEGQEDLDVASGLQERHPARACFHTQQAAGQALKAILYAAGERPDLGHSLRELGKATVAYHPSYEEIRAEVTKLDRYYIPTRYPNGLPEGGLPSESFDAEDARTAIEIAEKALDAARTFIEARG